MKVLIIRLSAFGDIIHTLPALDDVLNTPAVDEVHWLVDLRYAFVTELLPKQVVVHTIDLRGNNPVSSIWKTVRSLRRVGFDTILDLQGLLKSAALARAIGGNIYGIDKKQMREPASACFLQPVACHPDEKHVVQHNRRAAAGLEGNNPNMIPATPLPYKAPHVDLSGSSILLDEELHSRLGLTGKAYVILHSAGGWETKHLPESSWLAIANSLAATGKTAVFSWGNTAEQELAQKLANACNGFTLPERLNMSALCTLIQGAKAVVGADTGLLHLAAALNTPTVTFWGPSASWRSAPFANAEIEGDLHWHIESNPACGPCFKRSCDQFVCMNAIDPDSIIRILHEL